MTTIVTNRNVDFDDLLTRQSYLVTQANDLAKSFGGLSKVEHQLLDYVTSFITRETRPGAEFEDSIGHMVQHLGWTKSGQNYQAVAKVLSDLESKTPIHLYDEADTLWGEATITKVRLFSKIKFGQSGRIAWSFSPEVTPYLMELKEKYFSIPLSELAGIKSKYTLTLLKLWRANRIGKTTTAVVKGTFDEWEKWFIGDRSPWPAARFNQKVLQPAINELSARYQEVDISLVKHTRGRKIISYEMTFTTPTAKSV